MKLVPHDRVLRVVWVQVMPIEPGRAHIVVRFKEDPEMYHAMPFKTKYALTMVDAGWERFWRYIQDSLLNGFAEWWEWRGFKSPGRDV
jgi:hypothetical protein